MALFGLKFTLDKARQGPKVNNERLFRVKELKSDKISRRILRVKKTVSILHVKKRVCR